MIGHCLFLRLGRNISVFEAIVHRLLCPACLLTISLQIIDITHDSPLKQLRSSFPQTKSSVD